MGYYIETPPEFTNSKAEYLHRYYSAELVLDPKSFNFDGDDALICVVSNQLFDAAGIAYDKLERNDFNNPDDLRPKVWLKLPKHIVIKLCPPVRYEYERLHHH